MERSDVQQLQGCTVVDAAGDKIGSVEDLYFDRDTQRPEWLLVNTGLFGLKESFVPATSMSWQGTDICIPFDKATVKDAPRVDPDGALSQQEEAALAEHYGLSYSNVRSETGLPEGGTGEARPGRGTDDAMTRSEEELRVGTFRRPRELVRLRKYVVTENVTKTVPVQREKVRIEREPITEANVDRAMSGPDISSAEHEVTLHEDEVVTEKRAVPKERVRLEKDVVADEETVSRPLRKEQIEVEQDRPRRDR